jgi:hypothetical protein
VLLMNALPRAMLFSQMEPPEGWTDRFHHWYETDHIPARLALPGFAGAQRYEALDGEPKFLAVYDLTDLRALETPGYEALKRDPSDETKTMLANVHGFTRYTCVETSDTGAHPRGRGEYLFVVTFAVPPEDEAQFDDWYLDEHIGMLMAAPDWLRVRRYKVVSGEPAPWTHFALHELADPAVMDSPERAAARKGPKRDALADRPWFANSGRWLYRSIFRAERSVLL